MMGAPATSAALIDGIDVDAVAAVVTACPGVSGLFGGPGDAIASYLPGRRVPGVEVTPTTVTVHVRSRWGVSARQLLAEIATATALLRQDKRLEVVVADIDDPALPSSSAAVISGGSDATMPRPPGSAPSATAPTPPPAPPAFPTV